MRLRPPALDRPSQVAHKPGLRTAPGFSCGFDLRPSIARARSRTNRAYGLRLAFHAASTSGPRSPLPGRAQTGPTDCAWLFMRLRRYGIALISVSGQASVARYERAGGVVPGEGADSVV